MANYYTDVSFLAELPTKIMDWIDKVLELAEQIIEEELKPEDIKDEKLRDAAARMSEDDYAYNVTYDREEDGLWFHSDETFNVDAAVELLHMALAAFDCDTILGFEWANTCSKPRTDAFGGGAAVVSKEGARWMNTYSWVQQQIQDLEAERKEVAA